MPDKRIDSALDAACEFFQQKIGWNNGADFEEDRCLCSECESNREEAREALRATLNFLNTRDNR
jgi:hypothetical protein